MFLYIYIYYVLNNQPSLVQDNSNMLKCGMGNIS